MRRELAWSKRGDTVQAAQAVVERALQAHTLDIRGDKMPLRDAIELVLGKSRALRLNDKRETDAEKVERVWIARPITDADPKSDLHQSDSRPLASFEGGKSERDFEPFINL